MAYGAAEFARDGETIDLFGNTQVQIHDRAGQRFTTVTEASGKVAIEANVENVKHFAVDTPFLVAVVKGTKFVVSSGTTGSHVYVTRGKVGVEDVMHHTFVDVLVGQHASAGTGQSLTVGGSGTLQPITNAKGKVVSVTTATGEVAAVVPSKDSASDGTSDVSGNDSGKSDSTKSAGNGNNGGNGTASDSGHGHGNSDGNGNGAD